MCVNLSSAVSMSASGSTLLSVCGLVCFVEAAAAVVALFLILIDVEDEDSLLISDLVAVAVVVGGVGFGVGCLLMVVLLNVFG